MYVGNSTSSVANLMKVFNIADLLYRCAKSLLNIPPRITVHFQPLMQLFSRTSWNFVQSIVGFDDQIHIDLANLPLIAQNDVGGTSTKNLVHWSQMMKTGEFSRFNYGEKKNRKIYKDAVPTPYEVSNLKNNLKEIPILLIAGGRDSLVHPADY